MVDYELKEFCFEHLDLFAWREDDEKTYNVNSEFIQAFMGIESRGEVYTLVIDGRIAVIGGVMPFSDKTGYCFTMFSKYADENKITAAKVVKRMYDNMVQDMGLHRIVTYNRITKEDHNRWCEWLGFKLECIVEKFDDEGNDYKQYGHVI